MRLSEARALVKLRKPEPDRVERTLRRCVTIEDLRHVAWRRWPRSVRGYVEGGADAEVSLAGNRAAYQSRALVPSPLRDVTHVDLHTNVLAGLSWLARCRVVNVQVRPCFRGGWVYYPSQRRGA
jgi:hypothetical protein